MRKRTGGVVGAGAAALVLLSGGAAGALSGPGAEPDGTDPAPIIEEDASIEDHPDFM